MQRLPQLVQHAASAAPLPEVWQGFLLLVRAPGVRADVWDLP